jgi:hypothetical protein
MQIPLSINQKPKSAEKFWAKKLENPPPHATSQIGLANLSAPNLSAFCLPSYQISYIADKRSNSSKKYALGDSLVLLR